MDAVKTARARTVPLVAELVPVIDRWAAVKSPQEWLFAAPEVGRCGSRVGSGPWAGTGRLHQWPERKKPQDSDHGAGLGFGGSSARVRTSGN